jgi:hypothetical protein
MAWALDSPAKLDFGQNLRDDLVLSVNGTPIFDTPVLRATGTAT